MKSIIAVTYPRSGQTIFEHIMREYFGRENFIYVDSHNFNNMIPCPGENIKCHKTHDFQLDVPKNLNFKYIIRVRHPLESIVSWYRFNFERVYPSETKDEKDFFYRFAENKIDFWIKFVNKWIIKNNNPDIEILRYHIFLNDTLKEMSRVIENIFEEKVNKKRLLNVISSYQIEKKNNIYKFKHFEREKFKEIELQILSLINIIGIPSIFNENL